MAVGGEEDGRENKILAGGGERNTGSLLSHLHESNIGDYFDPHATPPRLVLAVSSDARRTGYRVSRMDVSVRSRPRSPADTVGRSELVFKNMRANRCAFRVAPSRHRP